MPALKSALSRGLSVFVLLSVGLLFGLAGCVSFPEYGPANKQRTAVQSAGSHSHRIRRGDTLYGIAFANHRTVAQLAAWNDIHPPYTIYPGQVLRLAPPRGQRVAVARRPPPPKPVARPPAKSRVVVVKSSPIAVKPVPVVTKSAVIKPLPAPPPTRKATVTTTIRPAVKGSVGSSKALPPSSRAPSRVRDGVTWQWPARGPILKHYSAAAEGKKGLQIGGREGQSITAAASGKIVYSGSGLRGYGQLIIIEHDKNYLSAYAHNRVLLATEGEEVVVGQRIAEMGKTGTSRVMLHFEIRQDGQAVNPVWYLPPQSL